MDEYNVIMSKNSESASQDNFHPDPRNPIEKFLFDNIPEVLKAYGMGQISFNFITINKGDEEFYEMPEDGVLKIKYNPTYKTANVTIAPQAIFLFKSQEYKTLINAFIHEVGHIITHRLGQLAKNRHTTRREIDDAVEETTESIAQIVRKLMFATASEGSIARS